MSDDGSLYQSEVSRIYRMIICPSVQLIHANHFYTCLIYRCEEGDFGLVVSRIWQEVRYLLDEAEHGGQALTLRGIDRQTNEVFILSGAQSAGGQLSWRSAVDNRCSGTSCDAHIEPFHNYISTRVRYHTSHSSDNIALASKKASEIGAGCLIFVQCLPLSIFSMNPRKLAYDEPQLPAKIA